MATYDIGKVARLRTWDPNKASSLGFTNASGVAADPTIVILWVQSPAFAKTQYTFGSSAIVKDSVGKYLFDLTLTASGVWLYKWIGEGAVVAASPDTPLNVSKSVFVYP